jgi:hypothetical protein
MPKTWQPHQAKQFARELRLGQTYYYVNTHDTKRNPYEDSKTYSEVVFTGHLPFTRNPCTDGGYSAHTLCQNFGPMYDAPPRGLRNLDGPAPQVGAPLGTDYRGYLDEAEIRGLEKHVRNSSDPHTRRR